MSQPPPPPQYSADGRLYWDGERWQPVPQVPAKSAPSRTAGGLIVVGGLATLLGAFLPWLQATAPLIGSISSSLISGADGQILAAVSAIAALIGLTLVIRGPNLVAALAVLAAAGIAGWIVVLDYESASQRVANVTSGASSIVANVGPGPYLAAIGIIVWALGGLIALRRKPAKT